MVVMDKQTPQQPYFPFCPRYEEKGGRVAEVTGGRPSLNKGRGSMLQGKEKPSPPLPIQDCPPGVWQQGVTLEGPTQTRRPRVAALYPFLSFPPCLQICAHLALEPGTPVSKEEEPGIQRSFTSQELEALMPLVRAVK